MKKFISWLKNPKSDIFLFAVLLVLINLVASKSFFRIDLTKTGSYSISNASKEAVKLLEEPLSVKVFFSANLPAPYSSVDTYVRDLLSEYSNAAGDNFSVEYFDIKSESSSSDENIKLANDYGLNEFQIREVKNNEVSFKNVFMGLVITYADQTEVLDGISSTDGLEYKITSSILNIISNTNALAGLEGKINVTLYKTDDFEKLNISGMNQVDKLVSAAFENVNKKFRDKLEYKKVDPSQEEIEEIVKKYGIQKLEWKDTDGTTKSGVLGLVAEFGEKFFVVPVQIRNMIFQWGVLGLDEAEQNLSDGILTLVSKTSTISYVTGHKEVDIEDTRSGAGNFAGMLSDTYSLKALNLKENDIPVNVKNVIVNGAKDKLSDAELYKIDQFVMKGGNLIVFADPYEIITPETQNPYQQQNVQFFKLENGMEKLLETYGVKLVNNYVFDKQCYTQNDPRYGQMNVYFAPVVRTENLAQNSSITSNLNFIVFLMGAPLDISSALENDNIKVTTLIKSSPASWESGNYVDLNPLTIYPPSDESSMEAKNLAVLLEGKFKSAFDGPVAADGEQSNSSDSGMSVSSHLSESTQNGKVLVFSSSQITTSQLIPNTAGNEPIAILLRNAIDYMNGNEDFCTMRTKTLTLNELKEAPRNVQIAVEIFNILGLAILTALAGAAVFIVRRNRRERIRCAYNPEDPRQISNDKNSSEAQKEKSK